MTISRPATVVQPLRIADATRSVRHVFIRDLLLTCSIGVHDFEKTAPQRVRVNLDLAVREESRPLDDDIANVVCYEKISNGVRDLASQGHVNLVETFAENIAEMCLQNPRVNTVRVRVEKLDVFEDTASVGVEIERSSLTAS